MAIIVERLVKGIPLTLEEHDANFKNINNELVTKATPASVDVQIASAINTEVTARNNAIASEVISRDAAVTSGDTNTLNTAKAYTDSNIATEISNRNTTITGAVTTLKGGVSADGDTLGKLRSLITGTNTGTNTGDETTATIKSKLGITTLSGVNTGDQTNIIGNAGTATKLATPRTINGVEFDGSGNIIINAVDTTERVQSSLLGIANGVATLGSDGKVPSAQLPSYVDDVVEAATLAVFPATGEVGKIYVALDSNKTYRWSGSIYVYITSGAVDSVAGKTGVVSLVKADVGLANIDNTSDINKPVSSAQATADNNVQIAAAADATTKANAAQAAAIAASTPIAHAGSTGSAHGPATISVSGFMSATDKIKLDGVAAGATANLGTVTNVTGTGAIQSTEGTTPQISIVAATPSVPGTMSAADKTKLDGISGTNTGDETDVSIKSKLGITSLSGVNTGDETLATIKSKLGITTLSGSNTGDETLATIKTKLGITTLSGSNTGDQTTITGNAGTATTLQTARTIAGVSFNGSANIAIPYVNLTGLPSLGSAADKNVPATGNALSTEVVLGSDSRLTDTRVANGGNADTVTTNANLTGVVTSVGNATSIAAGAITNTMLANAAVANLSGTNTGDETLTTIKTKLGITTLSGVNTGDQTTISGNAGSATILQTARTINGVSFNGSANITINAVDSTARVASSLLGAVNGVATLDASGTVPTSQLPSYVDDVLEYVNLAGFPATGEAGKIYVALDTNKTYRWSGSVYVYITSGAVDSVAGKTGVVTLDKSDVGLGLVDNTADASKPVSTAQQTALNLKANLISPAFTGAPTAPTATVGSSTTQLATTAFVGAEIANDAAPIAHVGSNGTSHAVATTTVAGFLSVADKTKLDGIASGAQTNAVSSVAGKTGVVTLVKGDVGLVNVDNTADSAKPVSTDQQTALNLKADLASPSLTGTPVAPTAVTSTNTTQIATTAFVNAEIANDAAPISHLGTGGTAHANVVAAGAAGFMTGADKTKLDGIATGATANLGTVTSVSGTAPIVSTGGTTPQISISAATTSVAGSMSAVDKTKLDGISGTNTGDETLATIKTKLGITTLSGSNTGDQSTITGNAGSATILQTARTINGVSFNGSANITINAVDATARVASSLLGAANGVATLDASGVVPANQLPSYVDDIIEATNLAAFPVTGEAGKIYVALDTNKTYRWSGTVYVYITSGAVDSVAGKTGVVTLAKADVGLGSVDNTADSAKPVSTAQATAIGLKSDSASPTFTGVPAAPTAAVGTSTTQLATTAFVNAEIASDATPISHVGSTGTAHGVVTASVNGFMIAADKSKLDGIASGATANTGTVTGVTGTAPIVSTGGTTPAISISAATVSVAGSMSAADKTKLDAITGSNTGDQTSVTGNAGTATKLVTARTINGVSFDGTANIAINTFSGNFGNNAYTVIAQALGTAQGQDAGVSFKSTFEGTADNGPRRSADIWSGFNAGAWGNEFLAFGVGGATDASNITSEKFRIGYNGQLGIGGANFGTAGQVLTSGGPSAPPTWSTPTAAAAGNTVSVISTNTTAVDKTIYVMIGSLTLTLPLNPTAGNIVYFSNRSNTTTVTIARNGQNIMGLAQDMTIDIAQGMGSLVFADATRGWVLL